MLPLRILTLLVWTVFEVYSELNPLEALLKLNNIVKEDPFTKNGPVLTEYDFIVVGSGPAGCALTNRLTENPRWKVLLLEAGTDGNYFTDIPAMSAFLQRTEYDWGFKSEKSSSACLGMKDQICPFPAGKAVGGSSVINAMVYSRGVKGDYDRWADMGNKGWSYEDVLPYFLKSEDIIIQDLLNSSYHSNQGKLAVSYAPYASKANNIFLEAGKEMGFSYIDYNGANHLGISKVQSTQRGGHRVSAAKAFLYPITHRPNFHISQNSRVTRVLIDPTTKRAYGVEFMKNNKLIKVFARYEVILSAGSFMSPFLLMHSGIGPKEHLTEIGIPVIQDLRVGDNLQEQINMAGLSFLTNSSVTLDLVDLVLGLPKHFLQWQIKGTGPLTNPGCESMMYIKTPLADSEEYPDVELLFVGYSGFAADRGIGFRKGVGLSDKIYNQVYRPIEGKRGFSVWPLPNHPRSRGYIRLYNKDPLNQPKIIHNFLEESYDVDIMIEAIKTIIRISQTKAFQSVGSRLHDIPIPGCENYRFGSDSYWGCVVRHLTSRWHHISGTCKMGPDSDSSAVVSPRLSVRGINGLRVADASIMPFITSGHTMAPSYMIGEKAADIIKQDWGLD